VEDGAAFSEVSVAVSLSQPIGQQASVTFRGAGASANGDVATLSGLSDSQLSFSYNAERAHLILGLGLNLPSGHTDLTSDEFETSLLLSSRVFNLQVPSFGTGFNVNPGVIWAVSLSANVVLGLAASYQYKGSFTPVEGMGSYAPGDEVVGTGGLEFRLNPTTTLSADLVFTTYGRDKLDGNEVFAAGSKVVVNAQLRKYFGHDQLWILGRYRSSAKNELAVGGSLVPEVSKTDPDNFDVLGVYTVRIDDRFSFGILGEGRFYQETDNTISGINLLGIGVSPELSLSSSVSIPARLKFQFGSMKGGRTLTGLELGVGISYAY
jgi:hypothetical protein